MSDWSAQPLSQAQLDYAALDALVLIRLRDEFERRAVEDGWLPQIAAARRRAGNEARRFGTPWLPRPRHVPLPLTGTDDSLVSVYAPLSGSTPVQELTEISSLDLQLAGEPLVLELVP